ncbi:MAG: hypothetical protein A2525_06090 [Sulfurimonas sp. RIFOXYD12_FULL_36_11]|nr:MAG: hypothetical protein A2525_06090 [Sulfurimonas sp. RIFOXYD12_FULL_36_11]
MKLSAFLGFTLMLLHFSSLKKSEKSSLWTVPFIFIGSFVFVTMLSYLFSLYENSVIKANRAAFYDERPLICEAGALQKKHHYLVSIKEGWSVYGEKFFKKDDLLLEIINCESN